MNSLAIFFTSLLLISTAISAELTEKRAELQKLYRDPIRAINTIMFDMAKHCERFPSKEEFEDFVLNGLHKDIRCAKKIGAYVDEAKLPNEQHVISQYKIGKFIPHLMVFLKNKHYEVISDTKQIYFLMKHDPLKWNHSGIDKSEYEYVVSCQSHLKECKFDPMQLRIRKCKSDVAFSRGHCYFGNKKIFDFQVKETNFANTAHPSGRGEEGNNKRQADEKEVYEFYLGPLKKIEAILGIVIRHCNRPPKKAEFKGLIIDGVLGGMRCKADETAKIINIIKANPYMKNFLDQNEYEVLSDPYVFYLIIKNDPKKWKYKYFSPEGVDSIVSCEIENTSCSMGMLSSRIQRCKGEKAPEVCYLDGKNIFGPKKEN